MHYISYDDFVFRPSSIKASATACPPCCLLDMSPVVFYRLGRFSLVGYSSREEEQIGILRHGLRLSLEEQVAVRRAVNML